MKMTRVKVAWGRRYKLTHRWRQIHPHVWRSRCGQTAENYTPDEDDKEPRCASCTKSLDKAVRESLRTFKLLESQQ